MAPDPAATPAATDGEVMASVDGDQLVIADLARDGAWVGVAVADAVAVADWR